MSNIRLVMGTIIIVIALVAQFYKKKFPENRDFLIACIAVYPFFLFFPLLISVWLIRKCDFLMLILKFVILDYGYVCSVQWIVAVDHIHEGEECDSVYLSSCGEFSLSGWKLRTIIVDNVFVF